MLPTICYIEIKSVYIVVECIVVFVDRIQQFEFRLKDIYICICFFVFQLQLDLHYMLQALDLRV